MAEPTTTHASNVTNADDGEVALEAVGDEALVARVSKARAAGDEDPRGVEELLMRAVAQNRSALDRLAR